MRGSCVTRNAQNANWWLLQRDRPPHNPHGELQQNTPAKKSALRGGSTFSRRTSCRRSLISSCSCSRSSLPLQLRESKVCKERDRLITHWIQITSKRSQDFYAIDQKAHSVIQLQDGSFRSFIPIIAEIAELEWIFTLWSKWNYLELINYGCFPFCITASLLPHAIP